MISYKYGPWEHVLASGSHREHFRRRVDCNFLYASYLLKDIIVVYYKKTDTWGGYIYDNYLKDSNQLFYKKIMECSSVIRVMFEIDLILSEKNDSEVESLFVFPHEVYET